MISQCNKKLIMAKSSRICRVESYFSADDDDDADKRKMRKEFVSVLAMFVLQRARVILSHLSRG